MTAPLPKTGKNISGSGFTLIELSIVLVIIGLIVGGVLVGQSLISAAGVRATISQIEKYNTAATTFREKYGYLPGDIPDPAASSFGFQARGAGKGSGDGNGIIEAGAAGGGLVGAAGEQLVFWVDLSTARLIDSGFSTDTFSTSPGSAATGSVINLYLPQAKLGGSNYVYVFSGGYGDNSGTNSNGVNYFGLASVSALGQSGCLTCLAGAPGITVSQAYSIDAKIDDGLPLSGNVLAAFITSNNWTWGSGNGTNSPPSSVPRMFGSAGTCFDDNNVAGNPMVYSTEISNGANVNCALTFKMQAGD